MQSSLIDLYILIKYCFNFIKFNSMASAGMDANMADKSHAMAMLPQTFVFVIFVVEKMGSQIAMY